MKKLINILNSITIIGSTTCLTVSCNQLKSLDSGDNNQRKHIKKNIEDNEEDNFDDDQLAEVFEKLKKLKKITANTMADNKNTIENLIVEVEQSDQIKAIVKAIEFSVETKEQKNEILQSRTYQFKIILDQEHKVIINIEVISIDETLAKLDEKIKYEQIKIKINQYLKSYNIEADGELRLVDIKFTILEELKSIIKPYDIKFDNKDFKIMNDYFQDDEDIIFLIEENQALTINVNLNLTDSNLQTIVDTTNPISSNDEMKVKEIAVAAKIENVKNQINSKINQEFNQDEQQSFNVVSNDNDTYQDLLNEIKQRLSRNVDSDDIKLDNVKFKDNITLLDKIKTNQALTVNYDLVYNNFFYELDPTKVEEINNNKTFEFQIKSIDNLETKIEKVIVNSSFDTLFSDKTLVKESKDSDVIKKAEDYLYEVCKEIEVMKDKYKFDLIFTRDTSKESFDVTHYNGKPAFKLKIKLKKITGEQIELKQAFYFKVYDQSEKKEANTFSSLARTDEINTITPTASFGIREKIANIFKNDEAILKMQADGQNTFEDYTNSIKIILNNNEQINNQYIVEDVWFINPIYNNQQIPEKIVVNNKRLLIANNDREDKYSLSIKLNDKISNDKIKLNFIDAINVEGSYNLFAVQAYENKKIKTKIKTIIDKIINNSLDDIKAEQNTYQDLTDQLFNQFIDNFKMTNLEVKKENITLDLTDEETLASKISKLNPIKFKVDFGYTNKYGEHIDKLTFDNIEINNLFGSLSREKIEENFIQQLKELILKFEKLDETSAIYEKIFARANRNETVEQLINELNEKFADILKTGFYIKNTEYFDFKITFASDNNEKLFEKDIIPTKPISLILNVFNKNGNEKVINDLSFKIKIREANESDETQEKLVVLKKIFETATLDLSSFSDQDNRYIDNYPTWKILLDDIKKDKSLKTAIDNYINEHINIDEFAKISKFINEFEFKIKSWSKVESNPEKNYVLNKDPQILIVSIIFSKQNPQSISIKLEVKLGQFSEDNFNKAIAKDIYNEAKKHFSEAISIKDTDAVKPKDEKNGEDDIVYFDYQTLKERIKTFINSKLKVFLQNKKQQYHLTDEDVNFDIMFDNSLTDNLKHKDDDLVRFNDELTFTLNIKVKSSILNMSANEKFTLTIKDNNGYIDSQVGLDKFEQEKLDKLKEVILKILAKDTNSSNNEYDLKDQYYEVGDQKLGYEIGKFETKKDVEKYFQILLERIKDDLRLNKTLKNWKINLDDYNISLGHEKNIDLSTSMFGESNYVVLKIELKINNKISEAKIKYISKNNDEYNKHIKVNELINKIKNVLNKGSDENKNESDTFFKKNNLYWGFIIYPERYIKGKNAERLKDLTNYLRQIKEIFKEDNVTIDFEINCDGEIYDLKESIINKKYKINFPKQNQYNDIKISLNIRINGQLFEGKKTLILSLHNNLKDWQDVLIWYFNNNKTEGDTKKFDDILNCKIEWDN